MELSVTPAGDLRLCKARGVSINEVKIGNEPGMQVGQCGGTRYSNGKVELQGKGMDWTLTELGASTTLESCKQYAAPAKP